MTLNTGRAIDPSHMPDFFDFSSINPADLFVDDGRTPPPQPLTQEGTGAPPNPGGTISRPVNPNDDLTPHLDFDLNTLPVQNGDIGYWSGEDGAENPFWTTPHTLLPAGAGDNTANLPNGGPDGVSDLKKFTHEDWLRAEEARKKADQEYVDKHTLKKWEDRHKDAGDAGGGRSWLDDAWDYIFGDWSFFYTDPEQSTGEVANPHDMIGSLLGKGSTALPDGLGFDKELIGRMLGGYGEGDSSNAGKFADFLNALDAFDSATPGAAGALLNQFGLEEFAGVVREFLPHLDLDAASLEALMKTASTFQEPYDFSHLLAANTDIRAEFIV
jgi:hypothetical protein